jgi:hypothetical protein
MVQKPASGRLRPRSRLLELLSGLRLDHGQSGSWNAERRGLVSAVSLITIPILKKARAMGSKREPIAAPVYLTLSAGPVPFEVLAQRA